MTANLLKEHGHDSKRILGTMNIKSTVLKEQWLRQHMYSLNDEYNSECIL